MPCIFILSAVSYLKTEIILFHVRGSIVLQRHLYGKTHHILQSYPTAVHFIVISHIFISFLFMLCLFETENVHDTTTFYFWHIILKR